MNYGAPAGYNLSQLSNQTPQQQKYYNGLLNGAQKNLGGLQQGLGHTAGIAGGDESSFEEMERPAYSAFQKQLGNLSNRFAGQNSIGSSGFQNAFSGATSEFQQGLHGQRSALRRQAIQDLLGHSQSLLGQNTFENVLGKKEESFGSSFGKVLPSLLSNVIGKMF